MIKREYKNLDKNNKKKLLRSSKNFITAKKEIDNFYLKYSLSEEELIARKQKISARNKATNNITLPLILSFLFSVIFYDCLTNLSKELISTFKNFANQIEQIANDALSATSDISSQKAIEEYINSFQEEWYPKISFVFILIFLLALLAVFLSFKTLYMIYHIILRYQSLDEYEISKIDALLLKYEEDKDIHNTYLTLENSSYLLRYQLIYVEKKK